MTRDAEQQEAYAARGVSRRALLAMTAPAALLAGGALAPDAQASVGAAPIGPTLVVPCACGAPAGPMRVVGWAAHRLP